MEIAHKLTTKQTTPIPSSPRDYRIADPICSNYLTLSLGFPSWIVPMGYTALFASMCNPADRSSLISFIFQPPESSNGI